MLYTFEIFVPLFIAILYVIWNINLKKINIQGILCVPFLTPTTVWQYIGTLPGVLCPLHNWSRYRWTNNGYNRGWSWLLYGSLPLFMYAFNLKENVLVLLIFINYKYQYSVFYDEKEDNTNTDFCNRNLYLN